MSHVKYWAILGKERNLAKKSKFSPKIDILPKNRYFGQNCAKKSTFGLNRAKIRDIRNYFKL